MWQFRMLNKYFKNIFNKVPSTPIKLLDDFLLLQRENSEKKTLVEANLHGGSVRKATFFSPFKALNGQPIIQYLKAIIQK